MSISFDFRHISNAQLMHDAELDHIASFNDQFQKAVAGELNAQRFIADCFYYGTGVLQDMQQAYCWYTLAASAGDIVAQQFLDICNSLPTDHSVVSYAIH